MMNDASLQHGAVRGMLCPLLGEMAHSRVGWSTGSEVESRRRSNQGWSR